MEESDKTTALKKAYAEIILNTAKEAAARVMLSERKAIRFQQDLCSTKEEALRMLVRLKQMIDAKTIEAEITSSNQQQRIDELEAQLQEAEDIITDLRSELRWTRDKLEKARIYNSKSQNATNTAEEMNSTENGDVEVAGSLHPNQEVGDTCIFEAEDSPANRSALHIKCESEVKQFDVSRVSNLGDRDACESELNVIMHNKELELHSNGCTESIRALEKNVLEGKPPTLLEDQVTSAKDDSESLSCGKVTKNEIVVQGSGRCTVLALRASSIEVIKKLPNPLGTKKTSKARKVRRRKKRRWGKQKASSLRSHAFQSVKACQTLPDLSYSKTSMDNASGESASKSHSLEENEKVDAMKACKGLEEHLQRKRTQYIDNIAIIRKGKRNKNMKSLDSIPYPVKPIHQLAEACQKSNLLPVSGKVDEDKDQIPENGATIKPLPRLDPGLTLIKSNVDPISGSTNLTVSVKAPNLSKSVAGKDLESGNKDVLENCESAVVSSATIGSEMVDMHPDSPDLKVTAAVSDEIDESPRKVDGNRIVKYTFQRKRKKGSLSDNDDNISPAKRKVEEKENDAQEANESTLGNESSRRTRRLVQVARQLISLSVKRW